jgi:hypothetical protein
VWYGWRPGRWRGSARRPRVFDPAPAPRASWPQSGPKRPATYPGAMRSESREPWRQASSRHLPPRDACPLRTPWRFKSSHPHSRVRPLESPISPRTGGKMANEVSIKCPQEVEIGQYGEVEFSVKLDGKAHGRLRITRTASAPGPLWRNTARRPLALSLRPAERRRYRTLR